MNADVLVIGSGASGAGAALGAARAGAKVVVVRRGYGATALSSGAFLLDLPKWLPGGPPQGLKDLLLEYFPLADLGGRKQLLSALGTVVEADLVFETMAAGALDGLQGKKLAVIGFQGLSEVRAQPVARGATRAGISAEPIVIPFPEAKHHANLSTPELARLADDTKPVETLAKKLVEATKGFDYVALPPLAGIQRWREARAVLDDALAGRWFELVAALPSVPGLRLQQSVDQSLSDAGVQIVHGQAREISTSAGKVLAIKAGEEEGLKTIGVKEVVLATGGVIGRGIRVKGLDVSEAVFDLPLTMTTEADSKDRAAALSKALTVDDELRPTDPEQGAPVYSNLRAAGEILGLSYGAGTGGLATAFASGFSAGQKAAAALPGAQKPVEAKGFDAVACDGDPLGCLNCGLCLSRCPAVRALSREKQTYPGPRGLMSNLIRWETELDGVASELSMCTLCGACAVVCPGSVPVPEAITRARGLLATSAPEAGPQAYQALRGAFEKPGRLFDCEPMDGPKLEQAKDVLFVGCSLPYYEREHAEATMKLLSALGVEYSLIDEVCCGGPLEVIGSKARAELAEHNTAEFRRVKAQRIITCCPRCAATMVESPAYEDFEIVHTTTLLAQLLPGSKVAETLKEKVGGQVVTFHDPCERARLSGEIEHAREVMSAVGLELKELPRHGTFTDCCGAGGGVRAAQTRTSVRMARLRVADALATGAPTLLTECPSCLHNLYNGRKRSQKIEISNLSSYLGTQL